MIRLIISDLDDTLIHTNPLYVESRHSFVSAVRKLGFVSYEEALSTVEEAGMESKQEHGFSRHGHPSSFYTAYQRLCEKHGAPFDRDFAETLKQLGYQVFSRFSPPHEYTHRTLAKLKKLEIPMVICTRGDQTVQLRRVLDAQLAGYFDNIFVVDRKTPDYFRKICAFYEVVPDEAVMIGNHMIGDVLPALEAGLFGIFVPNGTSDIEKVLQPPPSEEKFTGKIYSGQDLRVVPTFLERININEQYS
jgi:putative hydrolase of the HAD superfamily